MRVSRCNKAGRGFNLSEIKRFFSQQVALQHKSLVSLFCAASGNICKWALFTLHCLFHRSCPVATLLLFIPLGCWCLAAASVNGITTWGTGMVTSAASRILSYSLHHQRGTGRVGGRGVGLFLPDLQMNFPAPTKQAVASWAHTWHIWVATSTKYTLGNTVWAPLAQPSPRGTNTPVPKLSSWPENIGQTLPTGTTAA